MLRAAPHELVIDVAKNGGDETLVLFPAAARPHPGQTQEPMTPAPGFRAPGWAAWPYNALLSAVVAAEGVALRVSLRASLAHPVALALLAASLALAVAMLTLPALRPWAGRAAWVLLFGLLAYGAAVAVVYRSRPEPSAPELRKLWKIRQGIAAMLRERRSSRSARQDPVLRRTISEAVVHLDDQVIPALRQLVERQQTLTKHLARYELGDLPPPQPGVLERLQAIHTRQQAAIDECVQQAANASATLVALLQEGDDDSIALRARTWANDLLALHDSLTEVLHGTDDLPQIPGRQDQQVAHEAAAETDLSPVTVGDEIALSDQPAERLVPLVEEALRRVNDPAALTRCGLIERLPRTLLAARAHAGNGTRAKATPLEQARALREVLISAIDRLSPADAATGAGSAEMLRYHLLSGQYVKGISTRQLMVRSGISESTFHRYRREGVRVLAQELSEQEELLSRDVSDVASR